MKPIIIIGSKNFGTKNNPTDIFNVLEISNKQLVYWEDLLFEISGDSQQITDTVSNIDISSAKLVLFFGWYKKDHNGIYKDMALTLAEYLNAHGVEFWNSEALSQRSTTKLSAMMQLSLAGIDIPRTIYAFNTNILRSQEAKYPCILKAAAASRGNDNFFITSDEARQKSLNDDFNLFLQQEYIANDYDIRVICFDGIPKLAIKRSRTNKKTHLNNTSQGGSAEMLELASLPHEVLTNTIKICKIMKRQMAGVDWLVANDGSQRYACLEVNAIPQLTTGSYIEEKLKTLNDSIFRKD